MTTPYVKAYLTVDEQVELLRSRGMNISDTAKAAACLHRVGYYRLSGYSYPFRHREIVTNKDGIRTEKLFENFRPGTDFSTVMELYVFDKRLRLLFLDAIERIEVALRVEVALHLGKQGANSYRDPNMFNLFFNTLQPDVNETRHKKWINKIDEAFQRSREDFAIHYLGKYSTPTPIWISIEVWDFGCLATILNGMKDADLNSLSALYGLPKRRYLTSWIQAINFVRNICAHHGRLWNRPIVQQPAPPAKGDLYQLQHIRTDELAERRLYAVAAAIQYFMRIVHPGSTWSKRLQTHLATLPKSIHLSSRHMGFPQGWEKLPLWSSDSIEEALTPTPETSSP